MRIKWAKIFDWTIKDISNPRPDLYRCPGAWPILAGYKVTVTYVHHGQCITTFNVGEDDRTFSCAPTEAFKNAQTYYYKMREKMIKQKASKRIKSI